MRFKLKANNTDRWEIWFAWYPVKCDKDIGRPTIVWLEKVQRYLPRYYEFWGHSAEYKTLARITKYK